jgi:hypothetical protein
MIAASSARTNSAKNSVAFSKNASCQPADETRLRGGFGSRSARGALSAGVKIVTAEAVADMITRQ